MTKGVLLLAFGKPAYIQMAIHMAASIKYYNADLPITLLIDRPASFHASQYGRFFDAIELIPDQYLMPQGKIDPGHVKLSIPHMLPYDTTLFLDVDGIATQDVSPILDTDKDFAAILVGKGSRNDKIEYDWWAENSDVWEHFELSDTDTYYTLQTSAMLFRKGPTLEVIKANIEHYRDYPMDKLKNGWGGSMPDELIYSGVCAKLKHNPDFGRNVVFFGHNYKLSLNEATEQYPIMSMYGAGNLVKLTYKDYYDRHATNIMRKAGYNRLANIHYLSKQKHVA